MISAYPLTWPEGWKRTPGYSRKRASFSTGSRSYMQDAPRAKALSVADGLERAINELRMLRIGRDDLVVSTNVRTRLDGYPRSDQAEPADPGVAVYWEEKNNVRRVIAIDRYDRVADNLAAIAATLEAMRAIDRHGGAEILDRAFTGFTALPNPAKARSWRDVLGYSSHENPTAADVKLRYRTLAQSRHPDRGGSEAKMSEINVALAQAEKEVGNG